MAFHPCFMFILCIFYVHFFWNFFFLSIIGLVIIRGYTGIAILTERLKMVVMFVCNTSFMCKEEIIGQYCLPLHLPLKIISNVNSTHRACWSAGSVSSLVILLGLHFLIVLICSLSRLSLIVQVCRPEWTLFILEWLILL